MKCRYKADVSAIWRESVKDMTEYKMNSGRNSKYKYTYSNRGTGEILLEGIVTGGNKSDCKKIAHNEAMKAGLKPMLDPEIKFYITRA